MTHLFDGHSCIHKFTISNGKVTYSNKLLDTVCYKKTVRDNRLYPVFGTSDVCSNVFGRLKTFFNKLNDDSLDNVNVNIVPYGKTLVANNIYKGLCPTSERISA